MLLGFLKVSGHSMEPTFFDGTIVMVSSLVYVLRKPKIGDIVVFKKNDKYYIKRISSNVNNRYFLTGDNKNDSYDSRKFGTISKKEILAKVIRVI